MIRSKYTKSRASYELPIVQYQVKLSSPFDSLLAYLVIVPFQVFDAWDEVTQFFGETGEQEGWFASGSDSTASKTVGDSAPASTEVGGASEPADLGFWEQGAAGAGGREQAEKQQRPLNAVNRTSMEVPFGGPLQESLSQAPDLLSSLEEAGTVHAEELALAAEIMKELEQRKERLLLPAPEASPLPVAAARRSPLPPPMASAPLEAPPLLFQGFQPAAGGAWDVPNAAPARAFGGQDFYVAAGRPEPQHSVSIPEGNGKGGFVYERKDGVKVSLSGVPSLAFEVFHVALSAYEAGISVALVM